MRWSAWILVVGLGLSLAYVELPTVVSLLVTRAMQAHGLTEIVAKAGRPGLHGMPVQGLRFRYATPRQTFIIQANDAWIHYRLADLLDRQVRDITVGSVTIRIDPAGRTTPVSHDDASLVPGPWLANSWLPRLPLSRLSIQDLVIETRLDHDRPIVISSRLNLTRRKLQLHGSLKPGENREALEFLLEADDRNHISLALLAAGEGAEKQSLVNINAQPVGTRSSRVIMEGKLSARLDGLASRLGAWIKPESPLRGMEGRIDARWRLQIPEQTFDVTDVRLNSRMNLDARLAGLGNRLGRTRLGLGMQARFDGRRLSWSLDKDATLKTRLTTDAPVTVNMKLAAGATGLAERRPAGWRFSLQNDAALNIAVTDMADIEWQPLRLVLEQGAQWIYDSSNQAWRGRDLNLSIATAAVRWPEHRVVARNSRIRTKSVAYQDGRLTARGKLRGRLEAAFPGGRLPGIRLNSDFSLNGDRLDLEATLRTLQDLAVIDIRARHELALNRGRAEVDLRPVTFGAGALDMQTLPGDWLPDEMTSVGIRQGRLSATARLDWEATSKGMKMVVPSLDIGLAQLSGSYRDFAFSGLDASLPLQWREGLKTTQPAVIKLARLHAGLPIHNLDIEGRFSLPAGQLPASLKIEQARARLLGGLVEAEPVTLVPGRENPPVMLHLQGIELARLLELEQQPGLQGTGALDGTLPVVITPDGIRMRQGRLAARAPGGVIRYRPTEKVRKMAKNNRGIGMLTEALTDFRYRQLDITANYHKSGDLDLRVMLKGHNPAWQKGRPLHLNLTLQENIPVLLRSLQAASTLDGGITGRVQDQKPVDNGP